LRLAGYPMTARSGVHRGRHHGGFCDLVNLSQSFNTSSLGVVLKR
jgi:hypothetical protein